MTMQSDSRRMRDDCTKITTTLQARSLDTAHPQYFEVCSLTHWKPF